MENLNEKVRELRKKKGWTQEEFAQKIGVTLATVQRWEKQGGRPTRLPRRALVGFSRKQESATSKKKKTFTISGNNKGLPCPFKQILCEGGYCEQCRIYHDWQKLGQIAVVCAWCGREIYRKPGLGQSGISHGICLECEKKYFPKTGRSRHRKTAIVRNSDET